MNAPTQRLKKNNFTQGYMCACANLLNMNGCGTREEELFRTFGKLTEESLIACGVDPDDIKTFKKFKLI